MTTIVAVRKNGVAAIAADTLTTFGNTRLAAEKDASHDKILQVGSSYVGVCGSAAHHLVLASLFAKMRMCTLIARKRYLKPSANCIPS